MITRILKHFVIYLSTFPFTTNHFIGKFSFFCLLLVSKFFGWITDYPNWWKILFACVYLSGIIKEFNLVISHTHPPIATTISLNELEFAKHFIKEMPENTNANITTPLHTTAIFGRQDITNFLLKNGENVNASDSFGNTPLHYAVQYHDFELVKILFENGANVNAKDNGMLTPLFHDLYRVVNGNNDFFIENDFDMTKLLIDNGALLNTKDVDEYTLLEMALEEDNILALKMLMYHLPFQSEK